MGETRRYRYVGPDALRPDGRTTGGAEIGTPMDLDRWLDTLDERDRVDPVTFVVACGGVLRLAPRRSEHVACAQGQDVWAAGEMAFGRTPTGWAVRTVSNQSTGYCPDPDSWSAVAAALDRIGIKHPNRFTYPVIFRRCPSCGERNIVRDGDFTCALCDCVLPLTWNF